MTAIFDWVRDHYKLMLIAMVALVVAMYGYVEYLNIRPSVRDPNIIKHEKTVNTIGYDTVNTIAQLGDVMLNKPGGYMTNDILPPYIFIDDMTSFEYGVLQTIRSVMVPLRDSLTRNQTQSKTNPYVVVAFNNFNIDNKSFIFPMAEREYQEGVDSLYTFASKIKSPEDDGSDDDFYTRATSLKGLVDMLNRLNGNHAQRLGNAKMDTRVNVEFAGEKDAESNKPQSSVVNNTRTPWSEIDNVFWEAQGTAWATLEIFKAVRHDFERVLEDKNAVEVVDEIIAELEQTQQPLNWIMVSNGSPFGIFANHSLALRNYISNASQRMSDLSNLLRDG